MTLRDQILIDLARDEGDRHKPYDDETGKELHPGDVLKGNITIAKGVNLSAGISQALSDYLTGAALDEKLESLARALPWMTTRPDDVQRAIANVCFNQGVDGFLAHWPRCIAALQAGDYETAADEVLNGPWKDQVGDRADRVAQLIRNGAING